MNRDEVRNNLRTEGGAAGSPLFELEQLRHLQEAQAKRRVQGFETITVTCGNFLTVICCG